MLATLALDLPNSGPFRVQLFYLPPLDIIPMTIAVRPVLLTLAAIACLYFVVPTFTQGQAPPQPGLAASSQQKSTAQIKDLLRLMDEYADSYLREHHSPDTPFRIRVLSLYKEAYKEAAAQALGEMVHSPLSEDDLKALQQRLSSFAVSDLPKFDVPYGAPAGFPAELEARFKRIVGLWDTEGHAINKEHALWRLRFELSTFFQPRPTDEERTQLANQLTDVGNLIEKEILQLVPGIDHNVLNLRTASQVRIYTNALKDPFSARIRLLSPEQIDLDITQGRDEATRLVEVLSKNPKWNSSVIGSQVINLLWKYPLNDMAVPPDSHLLATYPQDLTQRYQDYARKTYVASEAAQK
ncbi:hypothetical protein IAD21_00258 [Abditibacteriota bacterium]|nr:hypothetical protein IAD21_00258 [Abditibacteriota bacterium]